MNNGTLGFFVTGTDTDVGKTLVSGALLYSMTQAGLLTAGIKAVAAGAVLRDGIWHSEDADALASASSVSLPSTLATPYLLRDAAAPHIAAAHEDVTIELLHIRSCYDQVRHLVDAVVVEGIGGFRVPLSDRFDTSDLAQHLGLPVIMVVGMRLGCLNLALLTAEAIQARGLKLAGWVANTGEHGMRHELANIAALTARLPAPLIGCIPRLEVTLASAAASYLDFSCLPSWTSTRATYSKLL